MAQSIENWLSKRERVCKPYIFSRLIIHLSTSSFFGFTVFSPSVQHISNKYWVPSRSKLILLSLSSSLIHDYYSLHDLYTTLSLQIRYMKKWTNNAVTVNKYTQCSLTFCCHSSLDFSLNIGLQCPNFFLSFSNNNIREGTYFITFALYCYQLVKINN